MKSGFVGQPVRIKKRYSDDQRPTTIVALYDNIKGGVRLADERDGFVSWNVEHLTPVPLRDLQAFRRQEGEG